jgi:phosphate-selective porin OprO/OprP
MRQLFLALVATGALLAPLMSGAQEKDKPAEKKPVSVTAGSEGFALQSESGDYKLLVRGYAHFDGRFFPGDSERLATNQFLLRRARPVIEGTLAGHFDFKLMPDFGGGTTVLQEAYLDVRYTPRLVARFGKFKSPVGLERLQSANNINFVERGLPTAVVPNRDVGIEVYGELEGGVVAYAAGLFDGAPDGGLVDTDTNDGKDLAGRVFLSPFKKGKSPLKNLGFGVAGTTGDQTGVVPRGYRSSGQASIVALLAGVSGDGTRNRISPQLSYYVGPFGLLGEYARSSSELKKAAAGSTPESHGKLIVSAWQASAVFTLTGEASTYGGVKPKASFDPGKGKWGALQLAARVHGLKLDDEAVTAKLIDPTKSVREVFAWGLGLNWYLNRHVRQMLDYDHASFTGGAAAGADRPSESAIFIRTQVSF